MVRSPLSRLHLPCFTRDSPDSTVTLCTHCLIYLFFKLVNSYFSVVWSVSPKFSQLGFSVVSLAFRHLSRVASRAKARRGQGRGGSTWLWYH